MFSFHIYTIEEMEEQVSKLKIGTSNNGNLVYEGFRYFYPQNVFRFFSLNDSKKCIDVFFVAKNARGKIVGVTLIQKNPDDNVSWWVSFVDIHEKWKRKGIATGLYKKINEWVNPHLVLFGSRLSNEGKEANLYQLRKTMITNCKVFDNLSDYDNYVFSKRILENTNE